MSTNTSITSKPSLMKVEGLRTYFFAGDRVVRAVDGLDFQIHPGEVFALVGESGCGKTVTAMSIMRLIAEPGRVVGGDVHFDGLPLLKLNEEQMSAIRGNRISLVFQDPQVRLNPVFTIGSHLVELFQVHQGFSRTRAYERSIALLESVGLLDTAGRMESYPHELSLGQAQRVMIALALALGPDLLIADEPTSALDVTIQAQILDLMREMSVERSTAIILIAHDMAVIAGMADRVAVMYAGQIVEQSTAKDLYKEPLHPYTRGLLASIPYGLDEGPLPSIPGSPPDPGNLPPGCRFAPRCEARVEYGLKICDMDVPSLRPSGLDHSVRCWLYEAAPGHVPPLSSLIAIDPALTE